MVRLVLCAIAFALTSSPTLSATGFCRSGPVPTESHHDFQFFAGYSPASATLIGTTTNRKFVAAGFDYSYRCWAWEKVSVSFTTGAMPAAILLQPAEALFERKGANYSVVTVSSHAVYGFALTPVGMTIDFARTHSLFPFFETNEGIIASTEPIPENVPDATALNFLFDLGLGVKWRSPQRNFAITFGYKFLHISNAYRSSVNPGVDNNLIYVGYSFLR